ncbi:AAA family ATPase [Nonomuraea thailandensis]
MPLFGREAELRALTGLIDDVRDSGLRGLRGRGGVLVQGEAGIGKSALVAAAASVASAAGLRVLTTTGVAAERNLAYAGLHQLLYPVRAGMDALPARQRAALRGALGLDDPPGPGAQPGDVAGAVAEPGGGAGSGGGAGAVTGPGGGAGAGAHLGAAGAGVYLVGLATLTLLAELAAARPLLVVAEDAHWLDRASADVLAFVARRIESEPIVMVATLREGERSPLREAGLPAMTVGRLSGQAAAELLDATAPGLTPALRERILEQAAGNPLALTELPAATADQGGIGPPAPWASALSARSPPGSPPCRCRRAPPSWSRRSTRAGRWRRPSQPRACSSARSRSRASARSPARSRGRRTSARRGVRRRGWRSWRRPSRRGWSRSGAARSGSVIR